MEQRWSSDGGGAGVDQASPPQVPIHVPLVRLVPLFLARLRQAGSQRRWHARSSGSFGLD